jgi:hypothetical protein
MSFLPELTEGHVSQHQLKFLRERAVRLLSYTRQCGIQPQTSLDAGRYEVE